MGWGLAGMGNSSAVAAAVAVVAPRAFKEKGIIFGKKPSPEPDHRPDTGLLRKKVYFAKTKMPEADYWPDTGLLKKNVGHLSVGKAAGGRLLA